MRIKHVQIEFRTDHGFVRMSGLKFSDNPNPDYNGVYTHLTWSDLGDFPRALLN